MSSNINISDATIALIDSLKSTTNAFGLAGTGSEYRIVTEMFSLKKELEIAKVICKPPVLVPKTAQKSSLSKIEETTRM